jgi:hypothetical protein
MALLSSDCLVHLLWCELHHLDRLLRLFPHHFRFLPGPLQDRHLQLEPNLQLQAPFHLNRRSLLPSF